MRLWDVAVYSEFLELAPAEPISGEEAYRLYNAAHDAVLRGIGRATIVLWPRRGLSDWTTWGAMGFLVVQLSPERKGINVPALDMITVGWSEE